MDISQELLEVLLARWPVARLATVAPDGNPHIVPVVFCAHDNTIYSPLDGKRKTTTRLRRFANLRVNPSATLLIDHYEQNWEQLWWLRIEGDASRFEPDARLAEELAVRLSEKYPQYQQTPMFLGDPVYLKLQPRKISAWSQSDSVDSILRSLRSP